MAIARYIADLLIQTLTKATSHIRMYVNIYRHSYMFSITTQQLCQSQQLVFDLCKPFSLVLFLWLCRLCGVHECLDELCIKQVAVEVIVMHIVTNEAHIS